MRKKRVSLITCQYCLYFLFTKTCSKTNQEVKWNTKACSEYELTNRFFCVKRGYWMDMKVCLHGYGPEAVNRKCRKCPVGARLHKIVNKIDQEN